MKINCYSCGKERKITPAKFRKSKSGKHFCSRKCAAKENNKEGKDHPNYTNGRATYRVAKLRVSDLSCEDCGNDDKRVLEVHHKDHDKNNNSLDNLIVLCANCHKIRHYEE